MIWPILAGLAGAALQGGASWLGAKSDEEKAFERERKSRNDRAAEYEGSGWSGIGPSTQIQYAAPKSPAMAALGGGLSGLASGVSLAQGIEGSILDNKLKQMKLDNPWLAFLNDSKNA